MPTHAKAFADCYEVVGECWVWTASRSARWGQFSRTYNGKRFRILGNVFAWERERGQVRAGHYLRQTCDTPFCIRPAHQVEQTASARGIERWGNPEQRFWESVDRASTPDGCWIWTRPTERYGSLNVFGSSIGAHRYSYQLHNGPIPDGMLVCHHCDTPTCVRPSHLFLGKPADNSADMARKGRARTPSGTKAPWAKLTADQVRALRDLRATEGTPYYKLGPLFGVSTMVAFKVANRRSYKDVA